MKKRLAIVVLALVMCLSVVLAACATDNKTGGGLKKAAENVKAMYSSDSTSTPTDYKRVAQVKVEGDTYPVTWTVNVAEDKVKVGTEVTDGQITISVFQSDTEDIPYVLTATLEKDGAKETVTFNYTVPKLKITTIADFLAAKVDEKVSYALKGHVMATGADVGKAGSFVIADETGSVFSYNKFEVALGDEIIAYGTRSVNSGVPQLGTTNVKVVGKTGYTEATATELKAEAIDLSKLSNETITAMTGKYYKVTGVKYAVSGGYAQGTYNGKQLLSLYTNTTISDVAEDYTGKNIEAYGYVRGFSANKYLTIQVTKIVCTEEVTPKTAKEKVDAELAALKISDIKATGDVTLATTGKTYTSVKIAWTVAENEYATIKAGKLNVSKLPKDADAEITLTATLTRGDIKETKEIKVKICKEIVRAAWECKLNVELKTYAQLEATVPEAGNTTKEKYYTMGYIKSIEKAQYGNLTIEDRDGKTLIVYGSYNFDGTIGFNDLKNKPDVGSLIVVYGVMTNFNGTKEMKNAWIMQIDGTIQTYTTEEKIAKAKAALEAKTVTIDAAATEVALPTVDGLTITWTLPADTTVVALSTDGLKVSAATLPEANTTVKATAKFTIDSTEGTAEVTITVLKAGTVQGKSIVKFVFPDEGTASNSSYSDTWVAKIGTYEFNIANFNNNNRGWKFIKCGSSKAASVGTISTKAAIAANISSVTINIDRITADKVNSIKLIVASDAEFKTVVETLEFTKGTGDQTVNISNPATGLYYKLEFDCQQGTKNGLVTLVSVDFIGTAA